MRIGKYLVFIWLLVVLQPIVCYFIRSFYKCYAPRYTNRIGLKVNRKKNEDDEAIYTYKVVCVCAWIKVKGEEGATQHAARR